jgi:hypothetical protein
MARPTGLLETAGRLFQPSGLAATPLGSNCYRNLSNNVRLLGRNTQVNTNGPARGPFSFTGAPDRIRTCDPQIRNLVLYPSELRAHLYLSISYRFSHGEISKHATNTQHLRNQITHSPRQSAVLRHRASLPNWLRTLSVFYRDCFPQGDRRCQP